VGKAALEVQKIDVEVGRKTIWQSCASGYPGPLIITYDYLATYTASHHFIYSTNIPFSPTVREREREREREWASVGAWVALPNKSKRINGKYTCTYMKKKV
jgi:hypothetical protein